MAELTGTRVRETLPDSVLGEADEVVLIDLTPEALIQRLRAGKVYPGERIEAALNNFFKIENLAALREVALRQVAEEVEAKRLVFEAVPSRDDDAEMLESAAPQAVGERLLALVKPTPKSQRVVRRAWRSAQRLQAELDILWVSAREPNDEEREQLDALRRLATVLGAHLLVERGDDVAETVRRVAAERGTTYVLMGTPQPRSALRRLARPALPFRLLQLLPGVDLRIVADRSRRNDGGASMTHRALVITIAPRARGSPRSPALYARDRRRRARTLRTVRRADPVPVRRPRPLATRARGGAAPRPRRGRDARSRVPRARADDTCRSTRRCRASAPRACRCSRRSSSAPSARGVPVDARVERGRTFATRCARRSPTSATTASSSPPRARAARASTATTSPGCSTTPPAKS